MFIGHFGMGLAAKAAVKQVSLGTLFLAAQFLDLLWPTLLLLGLERVRIAPGATVVTPFVFEHYPISHSLLAVAAWALAFAALYILLRRSVRAALVVGALVLSHWLLDVIVHQPDLPLYPGNSPVLGFNLWSSLPATLAVELPLFALGAWLYARTTKPADAVGKWGYRGLLGLLLLIYAGNLFGTPPPSVTAIAWVGQAQWLLVLWGYWVDAHRTSRAPGHRA